jgi:hypothetical protein
MSRDIELRRKECEAQGLVKRRGEWVARGLQREGTALGEALQRTACVTLLEGKMLGLEL